VRVNLFAAQTSTLIGSAGGLAGDEGHDGARQHSFGEQILYVADGNRIGMGLLGRTSAPVIDMKATRKADIVKSLADSYDFGAAVIRALGDHALLEPVRTLPFLGMSTRARTIYFELSHAWDIYGQMAVYLRLNGVVPPASQRP
jgi:hypothetical protein